MNSKRSAIALTAWSVLSVSVAAICAAQQPQYPDYPSETPQHFEPSTTGWDYARREAMIPMRDGVKLHAVILVPKGAQLAPILLTRTPYSADAQTQNSASAHLGPALYGYDNATDVIVEGSYIRVVEDIRGKYGSEGDYVMNRPLHGPLNPTPVDESTDTYDTIDWLVKNIPETNGKVGILGISYDGFLPLMALVNPHPALKVAVPMNPMVDGWMGDDWFHNGAFREQNMPYILEQEGTRGNDAKWWTAHFDDYDEYMSAGSAGELGKERGLEQVGFWQKLIAHPAYDAWWSQQAMDKVLAEDFKQEGIKVPTMLVHSLWDQEDIYGAVAVYKAIKPLDKDGKVYLTLGPWHHGQEIEDAAQLGAIRFGSDTGTWWRKNVLAPFLAHYLKDDAPGDADVAPVTVYETGENRWQKLDAWPAEPKMTPLYLEAGFKLSFEESGASGVSGVSGASKDYDEYISDPAQSGAVSRAAFAADRLRAAADLGAVAGGRPARGFGAHRCADLYKRCADQAGAHSRAGDCEPGGVDQRDGFGLGGEADRRVSGPGGGSCGDGRLPVGDCDGYLPRAVSRELCRSQADRAGQGADVSVCAAAGESRLPAGAPHHGAGAVELVPAVRSQSADVCAQHFLGQAGGL